jgi:head-tail adaptor
MCIHRIAIERNRAADGQPENWQPLHEAVLCRVTTPSEQVRMRGGAPDAMGTHLILLPNARLDVLATDRVNFEGTLFRILTIKNPDFADKFLLLDCESW